MVLSASAQSPLSTRTQIFNQSFRTLQAHLLGNDQAEPVITLNSTDCLLISFDELAPDVRYMRYRVIHCNASWQPDALIDQQYLSGFNEATISDHEFSRTTTVQYVHYSITIPNQQMQITASGNYLLQVFDESDPETTLLQVRFRVSENTASIAGHVETHTDIDYNRAHQQLAMQVDTRKLGVSDPYRDLTITVEQNSDPNNVRRLGAPMRITNGIMHYEHKPELIFQAGNEYRRFESINTQYPGMHIDHTEYIYPLYHTTLNTDKPRATGPYVYDRTQHGRYRVRQFNSDTPNTDADYLLTHFTLEMPKLSQGTIYIDGDLTLRNRDNSAAMTYNSDSQAYEATLLLKQGSYNYQYVADGITLNTPIEGNFYNTDNEYHIYIYHSVPGELYDRLVGHAVIYSN